MDISYILFCQLYFIVHICTTKQQQNNNKPTTINPKNMVYKKSVLRKLEAKLDKLKIKWEAITAASIDKGKSTELVRLVLKGDRSDNDNIIEFLQEYYQEVEKKINEVSNKINN